MVGLREFSTPGNLAGVTLAVGTALVLGAAAWSLAASARRSAVVVATSTLAFQVVHVVEHLAQVVYWLAHPSRMPWLTPWAQGTADGVGYWCSLLAAPGATTSLGAEVLHLLGNGIFMAGLIGLRALSAGGRDLNRAVGVESIHLAEHVVLTATVLLGGQAWGVSTGFGQLSGEALIAWRVLFHFVANFTGTWFAVRSVLPLVGRSSAAGTAVARLAA